MKILHKVERKGKNPLIMGYFDHRNWFVGYEAYSKNKEGELVLNPVQMRYFSGFDFMLLDFCRRIVDVDDIEDLQGYIDAYRAAVADIRAIFPEGG